MTFSLDPRIAVWEREHARTVANEPPPNSDRPPRRHHYVPELYLKRFAAKSGPKRTPRVCRIEGKVGPDFRIVIGVHDAAVQIDFYSIETDDPRRVHEAEHVIGVFERAVGYAFANLDRLGPDHFPDEIDRENLSMFMALQFARGPDTREFHAGAYTQISQMMMRVAASSPEYVRGFLAGEGEDASDEAVARTAAVLRDGAKTVSVTPHQNETVATVIQGAVEFMPYFFERRWMIVRSRVPFLTTDRPVVLLKRPDPTESWRGVGLATADQIVFVLDRHRALIMQHPEPGRVEGVIDGGDKFVSQLNVAIANRAHRWIFHHPDDQPLAKVPHRPNPKPPSRPGSR